MREVAFTNVTKMRTTWRKSGTITAWKSCRTSKLATRAAASPTARMSGTAESRAIAMIRRVPNKYRKVRPVTTQTLRTASARPVRSPDQISEDRVEAIVRALEASDLQPGIGHDRGELAVEGIGLASPDEQGLVFGNLERDDMVHPREGMGERLGEFRSLAHPAAIGPGGTLRRARETDELQGVFRGLFGLRTRHPVESQEGFHELLPGEPAVERVVLGAVAEAPLHRDVVPRILAQEPQGPLVRMQLADEELEQRALAGAIRTDEARDAGAERGRKAVEAEDLGVPLRDARCLDDTGHPDTTSTNFIRR